MSASAWLIDILVCNHYSEGLATQLPFNSQQKLVEIAKDKKRGCVERGEAIAVLLDNHHVDQQSLPSLIDLTETMISRLKVCYENLGPDARRLCKALSIQTQACHKLGREVARADQVRLIRLAQEFTKKRESEQPLQKMGSRGRQSPKGLITEYDMQQAIWADKYKNLK